MIKIEKTEVVGWEHAIRGMRNPMNSWNKSDTLYIYDIVGNEIDTETEVLQPDIGDNDYALMKKLSKAGNDHGKFLRMITVYCDITAPLYWWKEYDTYKVGTVANSCSTMHKIQDKEFTLDDFSHEHLGDCEISTFTQLIYLMNLNRECFLETKGKDYWWQMIQLLPSSYNQKRTCELNYAVLKNMYRSRKNHKLDEWRWFCEWVKSLPYAELITND